MYQPRIGCYAVYEPSEEDWQNWEEKFAGINRELVSSGIDVIPAPEAVKDPESTQRVAAWFAGQNLDGLHALIITWSFDHYTIEIQQKLGIPVIIRAIPGIRSGSIVGTTQLSCVLNDLEIPHRLYYGTMDDKQTIEQTADFARACGLRKKLQGMQMAVVGRRTEGMTPTAVDEVEIQRLFSVRLLSYGFDEMNDMAAQVNADDAQKVWQQMVSGASAVMCKTEHGLQTARNYLACKALAERNHLGALTIGSYPKCQGTMCAPIAWLNDDGLPTGCEGDVNSTLCMFLLSLLSRDPIHFGEMLAVDEQENSLVTSHCGCGSPSLASAEGYILHPVRLANDGVCIRFTAKPGPVTFVNLVGRKGNYRLCAFEGEAIPTGMVFEGNPLKFIMKTPFRRIWKVVAEYGFGHHWMTAYGHFNHPLKEYCKLAGITGIFPGLDEVV